MGFVRRRRNYDNDLAMKKTQDLESLILYENGDYHVRKAKHGYEVYKDGITHATRCAQIGYEGEYGLKRAIEETDRRANQSTK